MDIEQALHHYTGKVGEEGLTTDQVAGDRQKALSFRVDDCKKQKLLSSLTKIRDKARMGSLGMPHAGDWLNVVPSPILGLHLRPSEFRYSCLYLLGAPFFQEEGPCTACQAPSDRFGDHAISFGVAGERIARHNHLRDAL